MLASAKPIALSPAEAAEALGVSRETIYVLIRRGQLTPHKIGRCTRLNAAEVYALVGADGGDAA